MDYKKNYDDYIAYVKTLGRRKLNRDDPSYVYYERHHIVPKCIGGSSNKFNLVLLTAREHVLAHYLLCKIFPSSVKIALAFSMIIKNNSSRDRGLGLISSRLIASRKEVLVLLNSGVGHPMYGRHHTPESNRRNSEKNKIIQKGRVPWNKGIPMTDEAKLKSSNTMKGHVWSKERNEKISKSLMGHSGNNVCKVFCVETGKIFETVGSASEFVGTGIGHCLSGRQKTAGGFHWEYVV